jgi:hypothetical protein
MIRLLSRAAMSLALFLPLLWRAAPRPAWAIGREKRFVRGSAGRRSKRSSTFPSMTKTIVGMTTAGMVLADIGAVMRGTRGPAGAAHRAGTAGVAVITPAAMVATALASGMRVLRADAWARAALQRRGACQPAGLQPAVISAPAGLGRAPV